jgi:hypothetical protein
MRLELALACIRGQIQPVGKKLMGRLKQRGRQRFGDEIIRNGEAVCTIEGSAEVLLNVWNDAAQDQAPGEVSSLSRNQGGLSLNK